MNITARLSPTIRRMSTSSNGRRIGFVGVGAMGWHMAKHIHELDDVSQCKVWNRTTGRAELHAQTFGTQAVPEIQHLNDCDAIVSCVSTSGDLYPLVESALPFLKESTTWVDCSSGDPIITRDIGKMLSSVNVELVDAPVSGGPRGAEAGQLSVIVGGTQAAFDRVEPILESFAKQVAHVGPLGAGHAIKSINNALNVSHLLLDSEGFAALTAMGIDPAVALKAINASSGRSLMTEQRLPEEVLSRKFGYGFKLGLMLKDVDIAMSILNRHYPDAHMLRLSRELVDTAEKSFGFDADYTAVCQMVEKEAKTEITTEAAKRNAERCQSEEAIQCDK